MKAKFDFGQKWHTVAAEIFNKYVFSSCVLVWYEVQTNILLLTKVIQRILSIPLTFSKFEQPEGGLTTDAVSWCI